MGARPDENDGPVGADCFVKPVDEQEVSSDMTFAVFRPIALQGMVSPFGAELCVVFYQEEHDTLQAQHIVAPGSRQPVPILDEGPCEIDPTRQVGSFTRGQSSQVPQTSRQVQKSAACRSSGFLPLRP